MITPINTQGHNYNTPANAQLLKQFRIRDERIDALENKLNALLKEKQGVVTEVAKTKELSELKLVELKALCDENGIDYSSFGTKKAPYATALEAKGI